MALITLFPPHRRVGFIRKQAGALADYADPKRAIENVLRSQRDALSKIAGPSAADDHVAALRGVIYARLGLRISGDVA